MQTTNSDNEQLQVALAGFDSYCQKFILTADPNWDAVKRTQSVEYSLFLLGAASAIAQGMGQTDKQGIGLWRQYLRYVTDEALSFRWIQDCETALRQSQRLQSLHASGGNTAQVVLLSASRGSIEDLNNPTNLQLMFQILAEVRKLMNDRNASDEPLFAASSRLYDSVVGK